jgi:hypothetical protein
MTHNNLLFSFSLQNFKTFLTFAAVLSFSLGDQKEEGDVEEKEGISVLFRILLD